MASSSTFFVCITCLLLLVSSYFDVIKCEGIVSGLSWDFYDASCPNLKSIVREHLTQVFRDDVGQAAGLLRLHFHDCFVQGCDSSVLLIGSEQTAPPNFRLRAEAFRIVDDLRRQVHDTCGQVVSCSDILAISARDSVFLTGGPDYDVPLGRRDSLDFATPDVTGANLPPPSADTTTLLTSFATKNFTATDVVALSGGHTIGIAECGAFTDRLYPTQDSIMEQTFADNLKITCPMLNTANTTVLDVRSPNTFDNNYYVDLMNRQGLFKSDQDLFTDSRTMDIVTSFAANQTLFYEKFVSAMIKMSQLNVLTGSQGEIRANCSVRNSDNMFVSPVGF